MFFELTALCAGLVLFLHGTPASALQSIPYKINFQGRLNDVSGNPMASGTYNMKFRIYDAASGGTLLWSEQRANSATTGVSVTNGLFSVQLGDVSALSPNIFNNANAIYFEVELPTPATATCTSALCESYTEGAMTPRNKLGASAYSFNSDTLDGLDSSTFSQLGANNIYTGANSISANSTSAFSVINGSSVFAVDTTNSRVSIGTADATGSLLVLDSKNTAGDPAVTNGGMYYNSNSGKIRCAQNGLWSNCASDLQGAYDTSATGTITSTGSKSVSIVAGAAPTSDLFVVDNIGNPAVTGGTNAIQVNYAGGNAAVEGAGLRVDYTPGPASGGTWSGVRIVANATGPVSGVSAYGLKIEGPTTPGAGTEVGLRVASGFDIGMDIASGGLQLSAMNDPSTPAAGNLKVYARTNAGRTMLKVKGPSGVDYSLQPFFATNKIGMIQPAGGSANCTTAPTNGIFGLLPVFLNYNGTTTNANTCPRPVATTSLFTSIRRNGVTTSTGLGTLAGMRSSGTANMYWRGNAAGLGGFYVVGRAGIAQYQSTQRTFMGMNSSTAAPTNVEPSSVTNILGFGCDAADTNFTFMHNDGTGTATKDALTGSFPCNTSGTDMYEYRIYSAPNGNTIYYSIARLNTTDFYEGSTSADIPLSTQLLNNQIWITNNATAAAASIDIASFYVEADN